MSAPKCTHFSRWSSRKKLKSLSQSDFWAGILSSPVQVRCGVARVHLAAQSFPTVPGGLSWYQSRWQDCRAPPGAGAVPSARLCESFPRQGMECARCPLCFPGWTSVFLKVPVALSICVLCLARALPCVSSSSAPGLYVLLSHKEPLLCHCQ